MGISLPSTRMGAHGPHNFPRRDFRCVDRRRYAMTSDATAPPRRRRPPPTRPRRASGVSTGWSSRRWAAAVTSRRSPASMPGRSTRPSPAGRRPRIAPPSGTPVRWAATSGRSTTAPSWTGVPSPASSRSWAPCPRPPPSGWTRWRRRSASPSSRAPRPARSWRRCCCCSICWATTSCP